jgi:hypothetical protein
MGWEMSTDTITPLMAMTPTTQLTTLYAEYDGLLDALEVLQRKLTSIRRYNPVIRCKLGRRETTSVRHSLTCTRRSPILTLC